MKKILCVIGARPQFIKHAPLEIALKKSFDVITIHTGQHYDENMSQIFFDELKINHPKYQLSVGSHSHGKQTGIMLEKIEDIIKEETPDAVLVYGDTNSTIAAALAGSKLNIPLIHIEAGLRSFNKEMPEEINRILTDHVSDFLFAPTDIAVQHLKKENITNGVYMVGDVMCDMVEIAKNYTKREIEGNYVLLTMHRPYNTDSSDRLKSLLDHINTLGVKCVFPIHPRTKNLMHKYGLETSDFANIQFIEPQAYFSLISLINFSDCVITDSGGMQKEAFLLKKKCITLRSETEWVETLVNGWNTLVFDDLSEIKKAYQLTPGEYISDVYGKGDASQIICSVLEENL